MTLTQREYDEAELRDLRWKLADVEAPGRQVTPSTSGQEYRRRLREHIAELEERLSSEEDDTIAEPSTTTESPSCRRSSEALQSDQEKERSDLPSSASSS